MEDSTIIQKLEARDESALQDISAEYDCGILVKGRPDALSKLADGAYRVLDYKTYRKRKHTAGDCRSCIQVMLYADMLTKNGERVTGGDYEYLILKERISCEYTEEHKKKIYALLQEIADAIGKNAYPAKPSQDACRHCAYKTICGEGGAVS